jgi:hypothetical protein
VRGRKGGLVVKKMSTEVVDDSLFEQAPEEVKEVKEVNHGAAVVRAGRV